MGGGGRLRYTQALHEPGVRDMTICETHELLKEN
jgi:hypothetical protein